MRSVGFGSRSAPPGFSHNKASGHVRIWLRLTNSTSNYIEAVDLRAPYIPLDYQGIGSLRLVFERL